MVNLKEHTFNSENNTYVIAEIGINHGGSIEVAKDLIESASKTGCDAVKFQTYLTEKRAPKGNQEVFDILKSCELPFDDFGLLKNTADNLGIDFFSTPFDNESLDYLDSIDVDIFKIASFDVVNREFLRQVASKGKSIIMSVGMANLDEIKSAYDIVKKEKSDLSILHCISAYPTEEKDANLSAMKVLQAEFGDCAIGQSDHTDDIKVPLYAVAMGAKIIEKHFKVTSNMECVDSPVSITQDQMTKMVQEIRVLEDILGEENIKISEVQESATIFRRPAK
jgi:N,N'-diacetyllegionaminate synthase